MTLVIIDHRAYFPPAVKTVAIPKKSGGERLLGIPTVADRIAQMVVKMELEPKLEPHFHSDSYGYRPNRSPIDAVRVTRQRCWQYQWLLEFDIKGLFDNIDHELLMKAVKKHTDSKWVILYITRWLTAPSLRDGKVTVRDRGTPQGGVISPLLANLFLHYAFDLWMARSYPQNPFARYADDAVIHCRTEQEAIALHEALKVRLEDCLLELHPTKTKIVYCLKDGRKDKHPVTKFDFLGYTFRPRPSKNRDGEYFINFSPAVSNDARKELREKARGFKLHLRTDLDIEGLSWLFNSTLRGWINYYRHFYYSEMYDSFRCIDEILTKWAMRKYKRFRGHKRRARKWLRQVADKQPQLFAHWQYVKP